MRKRLDGWVYKTTNPPCKGSGSAAKSTAHSSWTGPVLNRRLLQATAALPAECIAGMHGQRGPCSNA